MARILRAMTIWANDRLPCPDPLYLRAPQQRSSAIASSISMRGAVIFMRCRMADRNSSAAVFPFALIRSTARPPSAFPRDKHHTSILLARAGLPCIAGQLFFLNDTFAKFRDHGTREIEDAVAAFARMAHPVFCKPNQGSRGDFAEIVTDTAAFRDLHRAACARGTIPFCCSR